MKKIRNDSHSSGPVRNWNILHPSTQLKLQQFTGIFLLHATAAGSGNNYNDSSNLRKDQDPIFGS